MIKYVDNTVFNIKADAIVNTVNCTGVMGAGLALEFALRYPKLNEIYVKKCENKEIKIGKVDYNTNIDSQIIINFPTKWHFKYPSKIEWIRDALIDFTKTYKNYNIKSVAFPKLGTLNGGLNWYQVKSLMEVILDKLDIDIYICLDNLPAEGLEKDMLDIFNNINFNTLPKTELKLTDKKREILTTAQPVKRFWQIKELDGIGIKCYSDLFTYCKEKARPSIQQTSLFD